jgi:hypothetical protein
MANHIFGDVNWNMATAVMYGNRMSDHLRKYRASPRPSPDDLPPTGGIEILDFC